MSIGFLVLFISLTWSVLYLMSQMDKGRKQISNLTSVLQSEGKSLLCILFIFSSTYLLRFISDFFIVPWLLEKLVNDEGKEETYYNMEFWVV